MDLVAHTLEETGLPAGRLELEITESLLMSNTDARSMGPHRWASRMRRIERRPHGLRFSEVVGAPVDDLQWIEYCADAVGEQLPMEMAQQTFGHASLGMTAAYSTTENKLSDGAMFAQTNKVHGGVQ